MAKRIYTLKFRTKLILVLLFMGYFFSVFIQQEWQMQHQQINIKSLEKQIAEVQYDNEVLTHQIIHTESEAYVEQAARDRLGWVKEGEIIFIEKTGDRGGN